MPSALFPIALQLLMLARMSVVMPDPVLPDPLLVALQPLRMQLDNAFDAIVHQASVCNFFTVDPCAFTLILLLSAGKSYLSLHPVRRAFQLHQALDLQ